MKSLCDRIVLRFRMFAARRFAKKLEKRAGRLIQEADDFRRHVATLENWNKQLESKHGEGR